MRVFVSGEPVSSWMMRGVLQYLTADSPEADKLRHMYIFKDLNLNTNPKLNPNPNPTRISRTSKVCVDRGLREILFVTDGVR